MSKEINDLKTVASFMILSLAISGTAIAGVNENAIADATAGITTNATMNELYGIPRTTPSVDPNPPAILYGIPQDNPVLKPVQPVNKLYGIPEDRPQINPVNPDIPPVFLYGIPQDRPQTKPNSLPKEANEAIIENNKDINNVYKNNVKNANVIDNTADKNKDAAKKDSHVPVNYVAPVIIPAMYIIEDKK